MMKKDIGQEWYSCSSYVQGLMHIRLNLPCQDYARTETIGEIHLAALSDGCGSSEISQIGSKLTVDCAIEFVSREFDKLFALPEEKGKKLVLDKLIGTFTEYLRNNPHLAEDYIADHPSSSLVVDVIKQYASDRKTALQMLGYQLLDATLLLVAVKGTKRLTIHIGDGFIVGVKNYGLSILHEERKNPDLPENATVYPFDIYTEAASLEDFYLSKDVDGDKLSLVILSSDGPDALIEKPNPKDEATFGRKFANKSLIETLSSNALNEYGSESLRLQLEDLKEKKEKGFILSSNYDDCSLAILRKRDIDILWSMPTRMGSDQKPLEPRTFFPGFKLPLLASNPDTKPRALDFLNYYSIEDPNVIFNVSKILDNESDYEGNKIIEKNDLRVALNAISEFDLKVTHDA